MSEQFVRLDLEIRHQRLLRRLRGEPGTRLPPSVPATWLALGWHANGQTGDCYPSHARLAEMTGFSRRSVIRAVHYLAERGLVTVQARYAASGQLTNNYGLAGFDPDPTLFVMIFNVPDLLDKLKTAAGSVRGSASVYLVWIALALRIDAQSECWPDRALLGTDTGYSRRRCSAAISALEAVGLISTWRNPGKRPTYTLNDSYVRYGFS
jgi:hypothetical protein